MSSVGLYFNSLRFLHPLLPTLFFFVIIRDISEFSKSDNSVYLSIFIEDFLFYVLFFITGIISIYLFDSLEGIVLALFLSTLITAIIALILFKRKFKLSIKKYSFNLNDFSFSGSLKCMILDNNKIVDFPTAVYNLKKLTIFSRLSCFEKSSSRARKEASF